MLGYLWAVFAFDHNMLYFVVLLLLLLQVQVGLAQARRKCR